MPKDVILTPEGLGEAEGRASDAGLDRPSAKRSRNASRRRANSETSRRTPSTTTPRTSRRWSRAASCSSQEKLRLARSPASRRRPRPPTSSRSARSCTSRTRRPASRCKYTIVGSAEAKPDRAQALQRVAGRPRAARAQAQRDRRREGPARPGAQAQDHQDRRRPRVGSPRMGAHRGSTPPAGEPTGARPARADRRAPGEGSSACARPTSSAFPYEFPGRRADRAGAGGLRAPADRGGDRRPSPPGRARSAAIRRGGRAGFLDLVDRTGKIQLHAREDVLGKEAFKRLTTLDSGDLIGVDGAPLRSRRGELTLRVDPFSCSRKSLRPPPEKHHGLATSRRAFADASPIWSPTSRPARLFIDPARSSQRSAPTSTKTASSRSRRRSPAALRRCPGSPVHDPSQCARPRPVPADRDRAVPQAPCWWVGWSACTSSARTSATRALSTKHNPEFTMVELYEAYADYRGEAERLLREIVRRAARRRRLRGRARLRLPVAAGDVLRGRRRGPRASKLGADREASALAQLPSPPAGWSVTGRGGELGGRWPTTCSPSTSSLRLQQPTFVLDYPVELSPVRAGPIASQSGLVQRWEAFAGGMEIANAFSELTDPDHPARALRGPAASAGAGRGGVPALRRGASWRRSSRGCRRPGGWASESIAG